MTDEKYLQQALALAAKAESLGEVPIGAVIVLNDVIIGEGYNQPIFSCDPSAHAEIIAMRNAAQKIGNYRLLDTTLYVTLEPCMMCMGAMVHARVKRVVFGSHDSKAVNNKLNHKIDIVGGVLEQRCSRQLHDFFISKRTNKK